MLIHAERRKWNMLKTMGKTAFTQLHLAQVEFHVVSVIIYPLWVKLYIESYRLQLAQVIFYIA
jgi:hypothetical protein